MTTFWIHVDTGSRLAFALTRLGWIRKPQWIPRSRGPKKLRPALGGELAARDPVWDGEGWGCDRVACLLVSLFGY